MMIDGEETESDMFFPNQNFFEYNNCMENLNNSIPNESCLNRLEKEKEPESKSNDKNLLTTIMSLNRSKQFNILPKMEIKKREFSVPSIKLYQKNTDYDSNKNEKFNLLSSIKENKVNFSLNLSEVKKLPSNTFNFTNFNLKAPQLALTKTQNKNQSLNNKDQNLNYPPSPQNLNIITEKKENNALKSSYIILPKKKFILNQNVSSNDEKDLNQNFVSMNCKDQEVKELNNKFEFSDKKQNYISILTKNQNCKIEKRKFEFTLPKLKQIESENMEMRIMDDKKYSFLENLEDILEKISENSENEEVFQISKDQAYYYPKINESKNSPINKKKKYLERKELFEMSLSEKETANFEFQHQFNNRKFNTVGKMMNKEALRIEKIGDDFAKEINKLKLVFDCLETNIVEKKSNIFFLFFFLNYFILVFQANLNSHLASCVYLHNSIVETVENVVAENLYFLSEQEELIQSPLNYI